MKRLIALAAALLAMLGTALVVTPTTADATTLPAWRNTAITWTNPLARDPRVVDLTYATHPGYDRVVIHLRGAIASGHINYARRFFYDGSGAPVPIHGRSGLRIDLSPARAHTLTGVNLYRGPRIARPHFDTLKALAFIGDFEGHVSFGLALTHRADYRVFWLHNPQRLVIDVRH
ncbi:AMIN-like domain-containing (lipo)protein [Nocardioides sp.]|uniref:AMIN-like domain-containing (lipo)protein n=1 Tax=Nocardioides sp. TaxID=35761 RepID=UPI003D0CFC6E